MVNHFQILNITGGEEIGMPTDMITLMKDVPLYKLGIKINFMMMAENGLPG
jgi:hypothetical protein